jgi:hypothetical protein
MPSIGWEVWNLNFSWFITLFLSAVLSVYVWLSSHDTKGKLHNVDTMAGDEGEDW